jgi:hypothetical protein
MVPGLITWLSILQEVVMHAMLPRIEAPAADCVSMQCVSRE